MAEPKLIARQWKPKDLLDDLQMLIDEQPDTYLSDRSILETAKAYLEEYFSKDAATAISGRWLQYDDGMGITLQCSVCHIESVIRGKYCYNCGTKMDLEGNDAG